MPSFPNQEAKCVAKHEQESLKIFIYLRFARTPCTEIFRFGLRGKDAVTFEPIFPLGSRHQRPPWSTRSPAFRF